MSLMSVGWSYCPKLRVYSSGFCTLYIIYDKAKAVGMQYSTAAEVYNHIVASTDITGGISLTIPSPPPPNKCIHACSVIDTLLHDFEDNIM